LTHAANRRRGRREEGAGSWVPPVRRMAFARPSCGRESPLSDLTACDHPSLPCSCLALRCVSDTICTCSRPIATGKLSPLAVGASPLRPAERISTKSISDLGARPDDWRLSVGPAKNNQPARGQTEKPDFSTPRPEGREKRNRLSRG